jgi:bifunctional non-homologous end joining protein LigD
MDSVDTPLSQEAVIVGWTEPGGARAHFGSLILGLYDKGRLMLAGSVGTGFTRQSLAALGKRMRALAIDRCPLIAEPATRTPAHWIVPKLVARIGFTDWTADGRMRHARYHGLREGRPAEECRRGRSG